MTDEVKALVDQLGGYTELGLSGRGLHVFVRAGLPEDVTTVSAGRRSAAGSRLMTIRGSWRRRGEHVAGTPLDEVPAGGAALEAPLDTYAAYTHHVVARAGGD